MKRSHRLSVVLHVLVHLAERSEAERLVTSEELAACVRTNAVVIRRTLAGLREAGLVDSVPGPGGGWRLVREADAISLGDVCAALGERVLFAVDLALEAGCRVQAVVSGALDGFLEEAEALLLERLGQISLGDLAARVHGSASRRSVVGGHDAR